MSLGSSPSDFALLGTILVVVGIVWMVLGIVLHVQDRRALFADRRPVQRRRPVDDPEVL